MTRGPPAIPLPGDVERQVPIVPAAILDSALELLPPGGGNANVNVHAFDLKLAPNPYTNPKASPIDVTAYLGVPASVTMVPLPPSPARTPYAHLTHTCPLHPCSEHTRVQGAGDYRGPQEPLHVPVPCTRAVQGGLQRGQAEFQDVSRQIQHPPSGAPRGRR